MGADQQGSKETATYRRFTLATAIRVRFCDAHHPWQRGGDQNEGITLAEVSQARLDAVAHPLDERPRERPGDETPAERYRQPVVSIG